MITLENHLEELARVDDNNLFLFQLWGVLKREFSQKLDCISVNFPHFSIHDSTHSKTICTQIERFLGAERISKLNATDTWFLLTAFYAHDLGMAIEYREIEELFKDTKFQTQLQKLSQEDGEMSIVAKRLLKHDLTENATNTVKNKNSLQMFSDIQNIIEYSFRGEHAKRSSNYIIEHIEIFKGIPKRFVSLLAEICEVHQLNIEKVLDFEHKSNGLANDYMHPRLIASLLCLGDLLDLDNDRFNKHIVNASTPIPKNSHLHLLKHESVKHYLVAPNGIEIKSDTEDIEVYRIMRAWCDWLDVVCNFLIVNWDKISPNDFGQAPLFQIKELRWKNSEKWLPYSDLKFTISNQRAVELLQGAQIYKDKFVCIRELIQNSVDATLIRIWKEITEDKPIINDSVEPMKLDTVKFLDYDVSIEISINEKMNVFVEISDKGTGISNKDIEHISNIGNTVKTERSMTINGMPSWLKPSGAFGLGLQSVFQLTDSICIITKTEDESPKKITMQSASNEDGYITIEDYTNTFKNGTKINFEINSDKFTKSDLFCTDYEYDVLSKAELIKKLIMKSIISKFGTINSEEQLKREDQDYIPVEIFYLNKDNNEPEMIASYGSIFGEMSIFDKGKFYLEDKFTFECYDQEKMSILRLEFLEPEAGTRDFSFYNPRYEKYLYFKNKYVCDVSNRLADNGMFSNNSIYRWISITINLLGNDANEILKISRNDINENFHCTFLKNLKVSYVNVICKMIDQISSKEFEIPPISDEVIIRIYQLSKILNYKPTVMADKFRVTLENYEFKGYFNIRNKEESLKFIDLNNKSIVFLINVDIDKETLNCIYEKDIFKNEEIFLLNPDKVHDYFVNLISHKIERIYVVKNEEDEYYHCIKAVPFQTTDPNESYEKDDYIILNDFIYAILRKDNDNMYMLSNKKNDSLSIPLHDREIVDQMNMVIPLPFDKNELKKLIEEKTIDTLIIEDFLERVCSTEMFSKNVDYISRYRKTKPNDITKLYNKALRELLMLLTSDHYKSYMEDWVSIYSNDTFGYQSSLGDIIDFNSYVTF